MRRARILSAIWVTTALSTSAFQAVAQEAPAPAAEEVGQIVVTGTRLQNAGFSSPTPLTSLGAEQIQQRAPAAIAEVLQEMPVFRASNGPSQSQRNLIGANAGQAASDLRGLGPSRTLTLVNGRRFVGQSTGGNVNTQVIPAGLVDRVEVVTGGASAAYGSDAVAGVVNFVLKDRIDGIQGMVQAGISEASDNKEFGFTLSGGKTFHADRGRVVLGVDFNDNRGVGTIYDRKRTRSEPGNTANPIAFTGANRPPGTPAQGFLDQVEFAAMTKGSVITAARNAAGTASTALNWTAFDDNGAPYTLERGRVYGNLMQGVTSNYGAGPLSNWGLKTPNTRAAFMGTLHYDVTESFETFFEVNYSRTEVDGFTSYHTSPRITILRDNPFLPASVRDQMVRLNLTEIDIGRVDSDWGGAATHNVVKTHRVAAGFTWRLFDSWVADGYVQHGRTMNNSSLYHTRESSLLAASYAVAGPNGQPVCGSLANNPNFAASRPSALVRTDFVLPNCVPFNPFGVGRNSQAVLDYVSGAQLTWLELEQNVAAANLSGDLFKLPAGPVAVATGVEFRQDKLDQQTDPLQEKGIYTNGNSKSYRGANEVWDLYLEAGVPLLKDVTLARSLALNGAVRRTHYQNSGWVTTWKVGAIYEPTDFLRFRATRSRDIRAPSLAELFSFGGTTEMANLVTNPFNGQMGRLPQTNRGNPALEPEVADTFTAGVVFQPTTSWLSGLRLSVDFYKIKVKDVIAAAGGVDILNRCFEGRQLYCAAIQFDNSAYGIRNVNTQPFNQAALNTNGVDIEVAYRVPLDALGAPGRLDVRALATWVDDMERVDQPGPNALVIDYAGSSMGGGVSQWTGFVTTTYTLGPVSAGLQVRLFSPISYDPRLKGPSDEGYDPAAANSINYNRFPSIPYFNANLSYNFEVRGRPMQMFGVVNNLLNRDPPVLAIAALNNGGNPYDYVGRTFKMGLRFQW